MKIQLNDINDMNNVLKKVADGDIVNGHYTIPDGVTEIGDWAFKGCKSLKSITIPDSVTIIGYCSFEGCISLESITIPDGVTEIGNGAFFGCTGLRRMSLPENVEIGYFVVAGCSEELEIEYR